MEASASVSRSSSSRQADEDEESDVETEEEGTAEQRSRNNSDGDQRQTLLLASPSAARGGMMASVSDSRLDYTQTTANTLNATGQQPTTLMPNAISNESGVDSDEQLATHLESPASSLILENAKEQTIRRLQEQLARAQELIVQKNAKCEKLTAMQQNVDTEIHELTEHLFQEAYKMVEEAKAKRANAEKLLTEANMKIDVLSAEVDALKTLVLTQSPFNGSGGRNSLSNGRPSSSSSATSAHHQPSPSSRRPSLFNKLQNVGNSSANSAAAHSPSSNSVIIPSPSSRKASLATTHRRNNSDTWRNPPAEEDMDEEQRVRRQLELKEVDPVYHREFTQWRERPDIDVDESPFLLRILNEEIRPCLHFDNSELSDRVLAAIKANTIDLELISEDKPVVKTCALSNVPRFCPFRLRVTADGDWMHVSQLCRNRIAAVCDFFSYLRYVRGGLVKCGLHDAYWDVIGLRKNIALARLGLGFIPKQGVGMRGSSSGGEEQRQN